VCFLRIPKAFRNLITPLITLKIQVGGSQVSKYQEGGMPFGVGDGFALTAVCVSVKLQGILKLDGW